MTVALVVLDAFPTDRVSATTTPTLWRLLTEGGWNVDGGVAELTAATYPNHATFVTGVSTPDHGIMTNRVRQPEGWVLSSAVGPRVPTLFDACSAEGRRSVAVTGDQNLIGVCNAGSADAHWPPKGTIPEGTARNVGGYIADDEVVAAAARLDLLDADFVFAQIDSVDGARHTFGANSDEAVEQCHLTDAALGRFLEILRPRWDDMVVMVVSDHDQEDIGPQDPADIRHHFADGVEVENQGTAALVVGDVDEAELLAPAAVDGAISLSPQHHVVWGPPGQAFAGGPLTIRADHGSPRTRTQLAVVGGGHPAVPGLAARLSAVRPRAREWAGHAAALLDLAWRPGDPIPSTDGHRDGHGTGNDNGDGDGNGEKKAR